MKLKRYKAAEELFEAVSVILSENDDAGMHTIRAAKLPSEWRSLLVRAANNYAQATGRNRGSNKGKGR